MFDGVHLKSNGDYWQRWHRTPAGSKIVLSLGPKARMTEAQAQAECRRVELDLLRSGQIIDPRQTPTLESWTTRYAQMRTDVSDGTLTLIAETVAKLIGHFGGNVRLDKITPLEAQAWRTKITNGLTGKPMAESTRSAHTARAKMIFDHARKLGLIASNPFQDLKSAPPKLRRKMGYVQAAAVRSILDSCPSDGWRALFAMSRWLGVRRGEALALTWADLLWDSNKVRVRDEKRGVERYPPIEPARCPSGLTSLLLRIKAEAPDGQVYVCGEIPTHTIHRAALAIIARAGVERYAKPFHALRGACATDWKQKYPAYVVNEWIGHTEAVSREHYLNIPAELYLPPPPPHVQPTHQLVDQADQK